MNALPTLSAWVPAVGAVRDFEDKRDMNPHPGIGPQHGAEIGGWKGRNGKTSFQTEVPKPATKPDPEISLEGSQPPHVAVTPVTKPDPEIVEV
ncbi:hypothetical protein NKH73_32335, partial [Mesorhizobium sp. M0938]|uniref:hypothetical protein n=1 Tax=unclassified Mesorhizobium TaxID=325217 RepID=UPI00333B8755